MTTHKFKVGQKMNVTLIGFGRNAGNGLFEIVRLMPADNSGQQYRIKSMTDGHERIVTEAELA